MENSYISIRNGVIATVIGGVILFLIPQQYVVGFFTLLWSGVVWLWEVLVASYWMPGYAYLPTFILAFIGLVSILVGIYIAVKGEGKPEEPEFKKYTEDFIRGVKWRWVWADNQISNVWCYCPNCDATLVYDDRSCRDLLEDIHKTDFICENCNRVITSITGGNKAYAISLISREIVRKIRTGEYKKTNTNPRYTTDS